MTYPMVCVDIYGNIWVIYDFPSYSFIPMTYPISPIHSPMIFPSLGMTFAEGAERLAHGAGFSGSSGDVGAPTGGPGEALNTWDDIWGLGGKIWVTYG